MVLKKYKNKKADSRVSEPHLQYQKEEGTLELHFFSSYKEMNEADQKEMASTSPEENFMHATLLIKQIFAKELKEKFSGYTIHFK
jgi:hypothetical protein